MEVKKGDVILIDTNVILECHRTKLWNNLSKSFNLCTVTTVIEETQTGYQNRSPEFEVNYKNLKESFNEIFEVTDEDLAICLFEKPSIMDLDPGERDLLIYASKHGKNCWLLSSPDKAAMRVANEFGWLDQIISLESLIDCANLTTSRPLKDNYTLKWHERISGQIRMGILC
jgi:hypothetical protein